MGSAELGLLILIVRIETDVRFFIEGEVRGMGGGVIEAGVAGYAAGFGKVGGSSSCWPSLLGVTYASSSAAPFCRYSGGHPGPGSCQIL